MNDELKRTLRGLKRDVRRMRRFALGLVLVNGLAFALLLLLRDASQFTFR